MAELKTKANTQRVEKFLNGIADEQRRKDCFRVLEIMKAEIKAEPTMWGTSIVGFGRYQYKYESGRELEWFLTGFSPRKQDLTLYIMPGLERYPSLMKKLGKHIELLAWGPIFGLALLFGASIFRGGKLQAAIRAGMLLGGALCITNVLCFVTGDLRFSYAGIAGYDFVFFVVCILLAILFAREGPRNVGSQSSSSLDEQSKHHHEDI